MNLYSLFESISGEAGGIPQGAWTTFVRFSGCNLACHWCDIPEAQTNLFGTEMHIPQIVRQCKTKNVVITGGEPLLQKSIGMFANVLINNNHIVQIETNGSLPLPQKIDPGVHWVIDQKTPSSCESSKMLPMDELFNGAEHYIKNPVYMKFVISGKEDIDYLIKRSAEIVEQLRYSNINLKICISPVDAVKTATPLYEMVDHLKKKNPQMLGNIILSLQLHKIIGMD